MHCYQVFRPGFQSSNTSAVAERILRYPCYIVDYSPESQCTQTSNNNNNSVASEYFLLFAFHNLCCSLHLALAFDILCTCGHIICLCIHSYTLSSLESSYQLFAFCRTSSNLLWSWCWDSIAKDLTWDPLSSGWGAAVVIYRLQPLLLTHCDFFHCWL